MSDKILPHHLDRRAVLYIRQSSPFQVANNTESQALQYAMQDRLRGLGWNEVEVIDEDLGRSAAGCDQRAGPGVVPAGRHLQGLAQPDDRPLLGVVGDKPEGQLGGLAK